MNGAPVTVLAVDSAQRSGWAIVRHARGRDRLLDHGIVNVRSAADVVQAVEVLASFPVDAIAIESPYIGVNAGTGLALAMLAGRWAQEFERRGVEVQGVLATVWQMGVLAGLISRHSGRDDRKRAAQLWARATFGAALAEDEADAAGLASFVARSRAFAGRCTGSQLALGGIDR